MEHNVWFISDLHIRHKNILKHQPNRIGVMKLENENDIDAHDNYIIDLWKKTIKRGDIVYVIGDFILTNKAETEKLIHKLKSNGCKIHLVVGNHDASSKKLPNLFESVKEINVTTFKKSMYDFLDEDLTITMCHYPMVTWPHKPYGALHLFGHIHNNSPKINFGLTDGDLAVNVGFDATMANYNFINLKDLYKWYRDKLNGMSVDEYINKFSKENADFIR